jgi:hypothetical protein
MTEQLIGSRSTGLRGAGAVQRTGTATDRRPRRQDAEDKRKEGEASKKRRRLYDLLFEEIDHVPELEAHQRERLKRNIRAHIALRARDQTPLPTVVHGKPQEEKPQETKQSTPQKYEPEQEPEHETLINIAAPISPDLSPEEIDQNTQLAAQLRYCLTQNTETARKVAIYLKILLTIDHALDPHVVIDI